MTHDYSYIDLGSERSGPLEGVLSARDLLGDDPGLKVVVLPYRNIEAVWTETNRYSLLHSLVRGLRQSRLKPVEPVSDGDTSVIWAPHENTADTRAPGTDTFMRFTDCRRAEIDQLCHALIGARNATDYCIVFLHAAAFRRLHDIAEYSATTFPSFLLRDDGELRRQPGRWDSASKQSAAWLGAGWLNLAQREQCADVSPKCYDQIGHLIDQESIALCERHLLSGITESTRVPSASEIKSTRRQVALLLTAYLPQFKEHPDSTYWQTYGADAETGLLPLFGPAPWENWLDPRLGALERDLLFEGWLTPFEDQAGARTLQPASLTLLFWAARVMDLRFTDEPQEFIDHHDWHGWFGNRCDWP